MHETSIYACFDWSLNQHSKSTGEDCWNSIIQMNRKSHYDVYVSWSRRLLSLDLKDIKELTKRSELDSKSQSFRVYPPRKQKNPKLFWCRAEQESQCRLIECDRPIYLCDGWAWRIDKNMSSLNSFTYMAEFEIDSLLIGQPAPMNAKWA